MGRAQYTEVCTPMISWWIPEEVALHTHFGSNCFNMLLEGEREVEMSPSDTVVQQGRLKHSPHHIGTIKIPIPSHTTDYDIAGCLLLNKLLVLMNKWVNNPWLSRRTNTDIQLKLLNPQHISQSSRPLSKVELPLFGIQKTRFALAHKSSCICGKLQTATGLEVCRCEHASQHEIVNIFWE